jgi:hypothetical protein
MHEAELGRQTKFRILHSEAYTKLGARFGWRHRSVGNAHLVDQGNDSITRRCITGRSIVIVSTGRLWRSATRGGIAGCFNEIVVIL